MTIRFGSRTRLVLCVCLLCLVATAAVRADAFLVGVDPECTHATLELALAAAAANGPDEDYIYLNSSPIALSGLVEVTNQTVYVLGGYSSCNPEGPRVRTTITQSGPSDAFWVHGTATTTLVLSKVDIVMGPGAGRGLLIDGPGTTFVNLNFSSITDGQADEGGNIWIAGADSSLDVGASEISHGNATLGNGGGIYCEGGALVRLLGGSELHTNTAALSGGGAYVDSCTLRATSLGSGNPTDPDSRIYSNTASAGVGGGIAAKNATVYLLGLEPGRRLQLHDNSAPGVSGRGGGLWLSGSSAFAEVYNSWVDGNRSHLAGGGVYVEGGAFLSMHVHPGACGPRRGCSKLINNSSEASDGGGMFVAPGSSAHLSQTEISGNYTGGGGSGSALAITGAGAYLVCEGCEIFGNSHLPPEGTESPRIFAGPSSALMVAYSTIVENLVAPGMGVVQNNGAASMGLFSSIVQASKTFTSVPAATQVHCLIAQESASLPADAEFVTIIGNPADLFVLSTPTDFSIRRYSEAQDYCDTSVWVPSTPDMDGQVRGWDDLTFGNILGPYDLGADEWRPEVFAAGFESGSLLDWSVVAP